MAPRGLPLLLKLSPELQALLGRSVALLHQGHLHQGLQKLADAKREDAILPLLKFLWEQKAKLDPRDFSIGISACARVSRWQEASVLFSSLHLGKVYPNVFVYNATISSYEKSGHWQLALRLFEAMPYNKVFPTVVSYNSLISACEKGSEWQRAFHCFESISHAKLSPTIVSYGAAISALAKVGFWRDALFLSNSMQDGKITPDVKSYSACITSCERAAEWRRALDFFQNMCDFRLRPNLVSFNAIISACQKAGQWQRALAIFHGLPGADLRPDLVSYSALISSLERASLWQWASWYFHCLKTSAISPDVISYNATISACGAAREWQQALNLFTNMLHSVTCPTATTFASTIHSFSGTVEWQRALSLWQQAELQGHGRADFVLLSSMLDVLLENAEPIAHDLFESALNSKSLEALVSSGNTVLDLHGFSLGASHLAVRWWLQMRVAPALSGGIHRVTLVTGYGSSAQDMHRMHGRSNAGDAKLRSFLLEMLHAMGIRAEVNSSNKGRIEVDLKHQDLPVLLRCYAKLREEHCLRSESAGNSIRNSW